MTVYSMLALTFIVILFSFHPPFYTTPTHQFNEEENFAKDYTAMCESLHGNVVTSPYRCFTGKRILIKVRAQDTAQ